MKIGNRQELKRIAEEKSGHLDYKDFLKIYNYCTREPYSFMLIDARPTASITFKKTLMNQLRTLQIMTRKEQNKILDDKIESNINQYKVDRLNAEISAFSSGDLNKYEFLTRKDLKYKPNALDKARFQFSPLGQTFSIGLDKTAQSYQEEGITKLLKDIRDGLRGGVRPPGPDDNDDDNNNDDDDHDDNGDNNMPDLETEEEVAERIAKTSALNKFKNNMEVEMSNLDKIVKNKENEFSTKLNKLNDDVKKIDKYIKENNDKIIKKEKEYNEMFLKYNESIKELEKTKDELNKEKDNNQLKKNQKKLSDQHDILKELERELNEKKENIKTLKDNNENIIRKTFRKHY